MHPTHSRKTFPCFDEPAMKAVFHLTLIHHPGTVALSNGMETGINTDSGVVVSILMVICDDKKISSQYLQVNQIIWSNIHVKMQVFHRFTFFHPGLGVKV